MQPLILLGALAAAAFALTRRKDEAPAQQAPAPNPALLQQPPAQTPGQAQPGGFVLDAARVASEAMATNTPGPMRAAADRLEQAGYAHAAAELRKMAGKLEAMTEPGSPANEKLKKLGMLARDNGMAPELVTEVERILETEGDPNVLEKWAAKLETHQPPYPNSGRALRAKASAIRLQQGAGGAMKEIEKVLEPEKAKEREAALDARDARSPGQPTAATTPTQTEGPAATQARADKVSEDASARGADEPAKTEAMAKAASAAAKAAEAARTADPEKLADAARDAAEAAKAAMSPEAQQKAHGAATAAREAIETGDPAKAREAATKVVEAAEEVVANKNPDDPAESERARLAALVATEIRTAAPWQENKKLIAQYQVAEGGTPTRRGRAGVVDGLYGPRVAFALMRYMQKVPAPRYWPKAEPSRSKAKSAWQQMVKEGNVTVGALEGARAPVSLAAE